MKKLILHIGAPKCGSSALQSLLEMNVSNLSRDSIYYPLDSSRGLGHGNAGPMREDFMSYKFDKNLDESAQFLINIANNRNEKTIIISDESLFGVTNGEKLNCLFDLISHHFKSIEVIVAIREPSSWLLSDYKQFVKQGLSTDDFVEHVVKRQHCVNWKVYFNRYKICNRGIVIKYCDYRELVDTFVRRFSLNESIGDTINSNVSPDDNSLEKYRLASLGNVNYQELDAFSYSKEYKHVLKMIKLSNEGYEEKLKSFPKLNKFE